MISVHGHRGARAVLPENTIAGFEHAIGAGADYIELDVAVTRDDVPVASHDPVLNDRICIAPAGAVPVIRENTLAELRRWDCGTLTNGRFRRQRPVPGAWIPTLDEVLELGRGRAIRFNIELKSDPRNPDWIPPRDRLAELVAEALRRHGLEARAIVQSFDFQVVRAMKRCAPAVKRAALFYKPHASFVATVRDAGADIAAPHFRVVTSRRVRAAHKEGIEVIPWTVNKRRHWAAMIRAGVDGIITDDPAGLVKYLQKVERT